MSDYSPAQRRVVAPLSGVKLTPEAIDARALAILAGATGDGQRCAVTTCPCGRSFNRWGTSVRCTLCRDACPHPVRVDGVKIARSGVRTAHWLCLTCGVIQSHRKGVPPGDYVLRDNRTSPVLRARPCARCGAEDGTELHHWAPRAIFGFAEADRWPVSHLCPPCHRLWHSQMRKAGGYRLPSAERIDDTPEWRSA